MAAVPAYCLGSIDNRKEALMLTSIFAYSLLCLQQVTICIVFLRNCMFIKRLARLEELEAVVEHSVDDEETYKFGGGTSDRDSVLISYPDGTSSVRHTLLDTEPAS